MVMVVQYIDRYNYKTSKNKKINNNLKKKLDMAYNTFLLYLISSLSTWNES